MIFHSPPLSAENRHVLDEIHAMRRRLSEVLRVPRRWTGGLRRHSIAQAIRGSNSIEGYEVDIDDAAAALDDEGPLSASEQTFAEIRGYRQALGYVLAMAGDAHFEFDASTIRSMHFMLLGHDGSKSPGSYRTGPIFVHDDVQDMVAYSGPDAAEVPALVDRLASSLGRTDDDPLVQAAMAHLNLVMIHPFRDGNGRLARALQTLVLARRGVAEPEFASIEEWLGANTVDYYRVLAHTGAGAWHPERDASLWVTFNLRAHHMQAQTIQSRYEQALAMWAAIDELRSEVYFPERMDVALYEAALGYRIKRSTYTKRANVEDRTASRDLKAFTDLGLLTSVGETRRRHYVAGPGLEPVLAARRDSRTPITDPYPWLPERLAQPVPDLPMDEPPAR